MTSEAISYRSNNASKYIPGLSKSNFRAIITIALIVCLGIVMPSRLLARTFVDVPTDYWAFSFIETFAANGITAGCGGGNYCPDDPVTRAQMAVFLERGMRGSGYSPPAATGNVFLDVGASDFAAAFIEQFFLDGITSGCGGDNYCSNDAVTRAQMAVFLLRAKHGAGFSPPPATEVFTDVPLGSFAVAWIEQLAAEGITSGCGGGNYCPNDSVTRAQMAVFLVRTFGLVDAPAGSVVGSVSGTIIIAVSDDGVSVAIDDTSDRTPDVDSDNDGINDQFSFSLTDLPLNQGITIFLIVGGEIFPMYFDSDGSGSSDTNVFSLSAVTTVNLGFVNTEVFGEEGRAIPEMNPADDPDIVAGTENQTFPDINPPTGGLTAAELIENGLNALDNAWIGGADDYFEAAVGLGIQNNAAETDLARLLYALTQMIKWPFETASDGDAGDLNRIGDFLDRLGTPTDEARANSDAFSIPDPLPDDSPTGTEYQDFLFNSVRNDMLNSIDLLTAISPSFNEIIEDPFGEGDVEVDYGDVLALRGTFKVMIGLIEFHRAYDLGMDVDATVNDDTTTTQDFLSDNPAFLSLAVGQTQLAQAKATFISALADIDLAVETINNETDPQLDDFITVDDPIEAEAQLARANQAVLDDGFMNDGATFDLNVLFDVGVDFRNPNKLPPFQGDDVSGLFPDPTFGGAVIGADLNADVNPADGIPDILQ